MGRAGLRVWSAVAVASAIAAVAPGRVAIGATGTTPAELYYTINSPPALKVAEYSVAGDQLSVSNPRVVASLPGADGLAFAPDGDLLVGGGKTGDVYKVNPHTGAVQTAHSGLPVAYHLTVSADGSHAWTGGLPGSLAVIPLSPFGAGHPVALKGDDSAVSTVIDTPAGAFYTASDSYGSGSFGTIDLATLTTHRTVQNQRGAHGMAYDAFTKDVIVVGSYQILQFDPSLPTSPVSALSVNPRRFDQVVADGKGHLLSASNDGYLVWLDFSRSGQVGDPKNPQSKVFFDQNLDDIATPATPNVTPPAAAKRAGKSSAGKALLFIGVLVIGLGYVAARNSRITKEQRERQERGF